MANFPPSPLRLARARVREGLRAFAEETRGTVAVESIILLPLVVWMYLAMFTFFDMLRMRSMTQKATFTVADAYSRETSKINDTFVSSSFSLFQQMVRDNSAGLRVSVLRYDPDTDRYLVSWSQKRGTSGGAALNEAAANAMKDQLPNIAAGDEFLLVETWNNYQIPFKIGMDDFEMKSLIFMNPRFTSQLKWDDGTA